MPAGQTRAEPGELQPGTSRPTAFCRRRIATIAGRSRTTCPGRVGRHNFKFGFLAEWASKTEPLSPDYAGNYAFGHNAQNPFSTGNGYANALLGVFTTYTELTNRVDRDRRHWQTEGYVQDSWRVKPGLTLDYGVRLTHTGRYFDTRQSTAGFYEPSWSRARRRASTGRRARPACPGTRPAPPTTSAPTTRPIRRCCCRARSSATSCRARARRSTA